MKSRNEVEILTGHQDPISDRTILRTEELRRELNERDITNSVYGNDSTTGFGTETILRIRRKRTIHPKMRHRSNAIFNTVLIVVKLATGNLIPLLQK